jgi:hypothetical protein
MATVRWCREAVAIVASSPLLVLVSTSTQTGRNRQATPHVHESVDAEEAQAVRAEGLDPNDPAVVAALDPVRWELSLVSW